MTKIIGLTGGIGSGKTTIARLFQDEGIPVYIADEEAKKILDLPETIQKVASKLSANLLVDEKIDKKKLAALVFNNPESLKILNAIIHPLVKIHFDKWVKKNENYPYVVKEAAILFESGSYKYCDKIITVTASEKTRIERVIHRDKTTKEAVQDRINNQWTDAQRIEKSDFVIENENLVDAKKQFQNILKKLKNI